MTPEEIERQLARVVGGLASRVRDAVAEQHDGDSVFSPLGVWMLLAAAAVAAHGDAQERLAGVLGCPAARATELLGALLGEPPSALRAALALWTQGDVTSDAWKRWVDALPSEAQVGAMPAQEQADAWVRETTLGLLKGFPSPVRDLAACLVSVVATRVSWRDPFDATDAVEALPPASPWRGQVGQMLCAADPLEAAIVETEQAGTVAVLEAWTREGLAVVCVSAEPDVSRGRVLAAAHRIAAHVAQETSLTGVSLFDLPVGEGHSWSLTERPRPGWEAGQRFERITRATLPAWSIRSSVDLLASSAFAADAAVATLDRAAGVTGPAQASQETIASFDRYGFEAAALSVVGTAVAGFIPPAEMGVERVAELRFDHPFAAVAVGAAPVGASGARWVGLPMFEAWVTRPVEPEPERTRPQPAWMCG